MKTVYNKFNCSELLHAEYTRRFAYPTPNAGLQRRSSIFCLFKQFKVEVGAEQSSVEIERYNSTLNVFEEFHQIALHGRIGYEVVTHESKVYILGGSIGGISQKAVSVFTFA